VFISRIRRFVVRNAFAQAYYPFSRFNRLELGFQATNIGEATLELETGFDSQTGLFLGQNYRTLSGPSISFIQPSLAYVHDKSLFGYTGPFAGSRARVSISPAFGGWQFTTGLADYRRYIYFRPFTLAVRALAFGRIGRDSDRFPIFLGNTEFIRGYTYGSLRDNECISDPGGNNSQTGCGVLDQLIGSKVAVGNVELRFPLTRSLVLGFLPIGFPPIEGAIFFDAGVAWDEQSEVKWSREATDDPALVRAPLRSWGGSIRANLFGILILRMDYTKPLDRARKKSYWTISLGPTF
jgi:outer membrane protein assembly factor BamA